MDTNKNGILDESEKEKGREKIGFLASYAEKILDINKDGIITTSEYIKVQVDEVKKSDLDGNGFISPQEEKERKKEILRKAFSLISRPS